MSRVLVFGKNGQIGWELQRALGLVEGVTFLSREDEGGDLLNLVNLRERILTESPQFVFNAAGYTAVDDAENDLEAALKINAQAVGVMADVCSKLQATLVHYSTDYVFDGGNNSSAWTENHKVCPINNYGYSKVEGERRILASGCNSYIFRTSWVYGVHGKNFMKTILNIGKTNGVVKVVSDQIGTPTSAEFVADISAWLALNRVAKGPEIVNLVPNGATSWSGFARYIFSEAHNYGISAIVKDVASFEYPMKARRPQNSKLDNTKLNAMMPKSVIKDWRFYAFRVLKQIFKD